MKSSKIWKVVWIVGIYVTLFIMLYLVILYKVKWEYKDLNTYLYFYNCSHHVCTSMNVQEDYYNRIVCEDNECPDIYMIVNDNVILRNNESYWLYDFIDGKIINNKYVYYRYIGNDMYVVKSNTDNYGVIDSDGNVLVDLKYNYIDDYKNGFISYIKNNMYGIISVDGKYNIPAIYDDVILINDKIFAGKKDNIYQMHLYDDVTSDNNNKYNFVYAYDNIILVANNKKIDILDYNLNSMLLMKIDTYYEYSIEQERDSLDIYSDGEYIYFNVFINETEFNKYKYSIGEKKLITD